MRIYTRQGDDGTTALRVGERVRKDDARVALLGDLDESQAALGVARAECEPTSRLDTLLLDLERDLWIVMAEVATPPATGRTARTGQVTLEMVARLEDEIDHLRDRLDLSPKFSVPGGSRVSATLDLARTVVRRAERAAVRLGPRAELLAYLNRLSDLCWALARDTEGEHRVHRAPRQPNGTDSVGPDSVGRGAVGDGGSKPTRGIALSSEEQR